MDRDQPDTGKKIASVPKTTTVTEIIEHIEHDGGVVIEGLWDQTDLDEINAEIDEAMSKVQLGTRKEREWSAGFHGDRTKRLTELVLHSSVFRDKWLTNQLVTSVVEEVLRPSGESYWLGTAQVIDIYPGQTAQQLHRDLVDYPYFLSAGPDAPEVHINCLFALSDFSPEVGATRVIPGSNRWPDLADNGRPEQTVPAVMSAGSVLILSGKTVHGGGANTTTDRVRRGLACGFNAGYLVPEEAYPFTIPREVVATLAPKVQNMLGFRSFHNSTNGGASLWQAKYQELANYLQL